MTYVIDTNSLSVLRNFYPKLFPTFWDDLDALAGTGRLKSVREVKREIEARDMAHISEWIKKQSKFFLDPTPDDLAVVVDIFKVRHFEALVGEHQRLQGRPVADPFLIAAAKTRDACVITEERFKANAAKIPNVCKHFGVRCMSLEEMLACEGWSY